MLLLILAKAQVITVIFHYIRRASSLTWQSGPWEFVTYRPRARVSVETSNIWFESQTSLS